MWYYFSGHCATFYALRLYLVLLFYFLFVLHFVVEWTFVLILYLLKLIFYLHYIFCWINISIHIVLNQTHHFIQQYYYTTCIFFDSDDLFFSNDVASFLFLLLMLVQWQVLPLLLLLSHLQNQNCFCKTMVFMYFLSLLFAIICFAVNICHLHQDTTIFVHVFDKLLRNKAHLRPINTIHHLINCQCFLLISCIPNLHLQKIVWSMQEQKMRLSMLRTKWNSTTMLTVIMIWKQAHQKLKRKNITFKSVQPCHCLK